MKFNNAQLAFEYFYKEIKQNGNKKENTTYLKNIGFYIENPLDNEINSDFRKWNKNYADYEWNWYLSANPNAEEISKKAPIWKKHMDENGNVMSNYGWQWVRKSQLDRVIDKLAANKNTRQAVITIYDGKEIELYQYDTPCTLDISFTIENNKLCMTVLMRSNDLWFGFCNDQYCFSMLQKYVAEILEIEIGWYYHFAIDLHLYDNF
jgi:thymidylate synthase